MASISCCLHARVFLIRIAQLRVLPDDRFSQCATWAAHAAPLLRRYCAVTARITATHSRTRHCDMS